MSKAGLSAAEIDLYFKNNPKIVTLDTKPRNAPGVSTVEYQRNQIITQKWIAWTGNGIEAYNDFRRTGYPKLALVTNPSSESPTSIPVRLYYPNSEISANPNIPNPQPTTAVKVWWAPL